MWVRELAKAVAWHVLPNGVLRQVRRRHYYRVLVKGSVAEPELAVLGLFVKPGACAVDVGANFGLYTKALAELVGVSLYGQRKLRNYARWRWAEFAPTSLRYL